MSGQDTRRRCRLATALQGRLAVREAGLRLARQQTGEQTILDGGAIGAALGATGQVEAKRSSLSGGGTGDHPLIEQAARLLTIHRVVILTRLAFDVAIAGAPSDTLFDSLRL